MPKELELVGLLKGADRVFMVEQAKSSRASAKIEKQITGAVDDLGLILYRMLPEQFTIDSLLDMFATSNQQSNEDSDVIVSRYRIIRQGMSDLREGVVLINDAHQMNGESVQLLAQLIRHVRKDQLNWRFILLAATNNPARKFIRLTSIGVDCYYPSSINPKNAVIEERSVSYIESFSVSDEDSRQASDSNLGIPLAALAALSLCIAVGLFYFSNYNDPNAGANRDWAIEPESSQLAASDESIATPDDLQNYLVELQKKEKSFEDNLQSIKASNANTISDSIAVDDSQESIAAISRPVDVEAAPPNPQRKLPQNRIRPSDRLLASDVIEVIRQGDVEKAKAIAAAGETFRGRASSGESAMVLSAMAEQPAMIAWFLERGVETEFVDDYGHTALYYSSIQGDLSSVKVLVDAGANVNVRSDLDKTPLMAAVHNGHGEVSRYLMDKGASLDTQDHSGWSAIFYAVWSNRDDLAAILKNAGARDDLLDNDGYSLQKIIEIRPN